MPELIAKVTPIGTSDDAIPISQRIEEDPFAGKYGAEIIEPPYDLMKLASMLETSNILAQCVEAMETNIDGFGFTLEPLVTPEKGGEYPEEAKEEKAKILNFFKFCNPEESFVSIRRKTRRDLETTGNAYWELLRNGRGELAGIVHVPSYTVRLTRLDEDFTDVKVPVRADDLEYEEIPYRKRFRRYVQIQGGRKTYWKELGDPRTIDSRTGRIADPADPKVVPANEMLHFRIYSPRSPYGIPRWIGNLLSILGSRAAEEINYLYFDNKSVPPFVVLVSGGRLADGVRERLEAYVEENLKGRTNFHKALILEAEPAGSGPVSIGPTGQVRMDIKPLTELIQKDALFMRYDEMNREKVRSAFRLPPLYVGLSRDYTRATAEESRDVAEAQVFGPERDEFDFMINRRILADMRVKYWEFKTLSAPQENADKQAEMLSKLARIGLTTREVRRFIEQIMNVDLKVDELEGDWLDEPLEVYLAKLRAGVAGPGEAVAVSKGERSAVDLAEAFVETLLKIREALRRDSAD